MNVDVQIYLSNFKSFFNNNPNDLINLIGDGDKDMFFELVEGTVIENYDKGEDLELTKKQLIDIMLILTNCYSDMATYEFYSDRPNHLWDHRTGW